jgi:phospholipid/cholesterol/gamma-HCH transport system substrate-binding protein
VGALVAGVALIALLFFGGDGGHRYTLLFETGGQLVPGNEVLVGGQPVGTIEEITLTDDAQAAVEIEVEEPLHEGTAAVTRATSLSGIANRYVSLSPGPDNGDELADGATIAADRTTSPVDIDQLFATFDRRTRDALADFIQGQGTVYTGNARQANRAYRYLAPGLQSTERLFAELNRDQNAFAQFLGSASSVLGAVAERRDDLSALTENANRALQAIARENDAFDRSLAALPPALRQSNTTFVNLRAALDDLDPLVATSKTATRDLAPFLRDLRPVATDAVPVFRDLRLATQRRGSANDLADALKALPGAQRRGARSVPVTIEALDASQPKVAQLRPYSPDLFAFLTKFGQATAYYDGNGHYARVQPAGVNLFDRDPVTGVLDAILPTEQLTGFDTGFFNRCPGGATQPSAGSNPFLDDGALSGVCDPLAVPPGP